MRNLVLSITLLMTLLFESRMTSVTELSEGRRSSNERLPENETVVANSGLTVTLSTPTNQTIFFKREDEETVKPEASERDIPHLILKRDGVSTPGFERTLIVSLRNVVVPPSGAYVQLTIETQHADPDVDRRDQHRIRVWRESTYVPYDARNQKPAKVQFTVRFAPTTQLADQVFETPTDYFRCRIVVFDHEGHRLKSYVEDYAFLMENQWRTPLPSMLEETPGAAPSELLIYYYDMVPFQTNPRDADTRIPRQDVDGYIQTELMPEMVKAFKTQTEIWDLPWYEEWSNSRKDEDPKTLSVALGGYRTWFHGSAPSLGHAMISIRVDGGLGEYANITDGIMSVFQHELFHNQQRNISLHFGHNGNIAGQDEAWQLFSEGTAVLASSVAQPEVQFEARAPARSYVKRANSFLGSDGAVGGGLNEKYKDISYHMALYWRFLYEHCGGVTPGGEDPATGMRVIRRVLETLYQGEIVQINSSTDVAGAFPRVMDRALQSTPSCPFPSYKESLVHFARAIYRLRLEDGRCQGFVERMDCGLIDPSHLYQTPPAEVVVAENNPVEVDGAIPSSYGIDLVEIQLSPSVQGKNLKFLFTSPAHADLVFHVEVWETRAIPENGEVDRQSVQGAQPISLETENGSLMIEVPGQADFDGLGLIITRMDSAEEKETTGTYSIQIVAE